MDRRLIAVVGALLLLVGTVDVSACGDKFLRIGRSARVKSYAVMYPASILFYVPAAAKPSSVKEFETLLARAGHRPQSVRSLDALSTALGTGQFDVVIAMLPDMAHVRPHLGSAMSKPSMLPVVGKVQKNVRAELEREFKHLLEASAMRHELLAEIDHTMKDRQAVPR